MAYIYLYSIPEMDQRYDNIPYFNDKGAQNNWFDSKRVETIEGKIGVEPNRTTVTIPKSYQDIEHANIDYCCITDSSGKRLYYFVTDYDYKTNAATTLILELDVMQTYMFDIKYMDSFIDRCHVDRWAIHTDGTIVPTDNIQDEGLQFGDMIVQERTTNIFRNKYLIASTAPLGKNDWARPSGGGGGGGIEPSGGNWEQGQISADGFRMLKGFEGFGPFVYRDSGGVSTIGYGTTAADKETYNKLVANQPVPEEEAAKAAYVRIQKNYGQPILDFIKTNFKVDNQNKFDALVDLAYNAGTGRVTSGSLPEMLKKFPNDESKVRPVWESYIIRDSAGHELAGLKARRKAECDVYFKKGYEKRAISKISPASGTVTENNGNGWLPGGNTPSGPDLGLRIIK